MLMNDSEEYILNLVALGSVYKPQAEAGDQRKLKLDINGGVHYLHYKSEVQRDADHTRLVAAMCGSNQSPQQS